MLQLPHPILSSFSHDEGFAKRAVIAFESQMTSDKRPEPLSVHLRWIEPSIGMECERLKCLRTRANPRRDKISDEMLVDCFFDLFIENAVVWMTSSLREPVFISRFCNLVIPIAKGLVWNLLIR
jgi:hypothetical protein